MASDLLFTSRQVAFLGAVTVSGTTPLEAATTDILASPFVVQRIVGRVTTATTVAPAGMTLTWRPTVGSGTGAITLGTFTVPVAAVQSILAWDFMRSEGVETVIGAAGALDGYGYGGSIRYEGGDLNIVGPSGSLHLVSDGGATAGVVDFFIEALTLPFSGPVITNRPVTQLNAVVT